MEESTSPRLYGDPCQLYGHLYSHFLAAQRARTPSVAPTPSTSTHKPSKSMLVTGFGIRNLESLQRALLDDEERRQMLLAKYPMGEEYECSSLGSDTSRRWMKTSTEVSTETETSSQKSYQLQYLMGLMEPEEEQEEKAVPPIEIPMEGEAEDVPDERLTLAMRKARKYLKEHQIFRFFQFLIAHMLSELPDNPIQFLIDLLDKCLVFRSGFSEPPLLYEKAHIEQLFFMMDRMRTGFIEFDQYKTGMKTLGICSFDMKPPLSSDGMVAKETFVEEAYDCLTDLFVEMIRHRGMGKITPPSPATPPPTEIISKIDYGGQ